MWNKASNQRIPATRKPPTRESVGESVGVTGSRPNRVRLCGTKQEGNTRKMGRERKQAALTQAGNTCVPEFSRRLFSLHVRPAGVGSAQMGQAGHE
eukprot:361792-Chlamydomonas_euryale.AAC.2